MTLTCPHCERKFDSVVYGGTCPVCGTPVWGVASDDHVNDVLGGTEQHVWDLYAAAALGGYLANPSVSRDNGILWAAVCADGLLSERRRRVETPVTGNGAGSVRVVGNGKVSK